MYTASSKSFTDMSECFVGKFINFFPNFFFDEVTNYLLSCCIIGEREVDFFVKQLFTLLKRGIIGLVCASNDWYSIAFGPQFIFLQISNDFLHFRTKWARTIFLFCLNTTKDGLKIINHNDCRLKLFGTDDNWPYQLD